MHLRTGLFIITYINAHRKDPIKLTKIIPYSAQRFNVKTSLKFTITVGLKVYRAYRKQVMDNGYKNVYAIRTLYNVHNNILKYGAVAV